MSASPRLRASSDDRAILEVPQLSAVGSLLEENRRRRFSAPISIFGKPLADLRKSARIDILVAASEYHSAAGEPHPIGMNVPLILAGHQPELFHPGVWIKNFALNGLARRHGLLPVNLIVDNDTAKSASVRLPARDTSSSVGVFLASKPFDHMTAEVPYEELRVQDEDIFSGFGIAAEDSLHPWGFTPMLRDFWPEVLRQAKRTPLLGERFAAARRTIERRWGCHNFELPISRLCGTEAFAWFACHLLADSARFAQVHNAALLDHRKSHRIRSKNHPVPELERVGDYHETPFWAWRAGQLRRNRLFVRVQHDGIDLRAGDEEWPTVPLADPAATVAAWRLLEKQGFKVRTRALTTTLFARLIAGDLFIHGIGGGKYDELTDAIIRRYFAIEPPSFVILSGTLLLPLPIEPGAEDEERHFRQMLRELKYNPQRSLGPANYGNDMRFKELSLAKNEWIGMQPTNRHQREERFRMIRKINEQFTEPFGDALQRVMEADLEEVNREVAANAIMQRRDYAFCLFPEAKLRDFCTPFLLGERT